MHLSDRDTILRRLITALTPGGVLVVSDFHCDCPSIVEEAPDEDSARLYRRYHEALHALTARAKGDITWATRAAETMRQAALVDVHTYDHGESWTGGSPGCLFHRSNSLQLQDQLVSLGYVTVEELTQVRQLLADPRLVIKSYLTRTSVGRRATA
jgi:hypothetical protein